MRLRAPIIPAFCLGLLANVALAAEPRPLDALRGRAYVLVRNRVVEQGGVEPQLSDNAAEIVRTVVKESLAFRKQNPETHEALNHFEETHRHVGNWLLALRTIKDGRQKTILVSEALLFGFFVPVEGE